jgi:uncharacterized protein with HEPN domain
MDIKIKKYLYDVIQSIQSIQDYTQDCKSFDEFIFDKKLRRAVERELQIIGEALKRAIEIDNGLPITDTHKIIGLRNIVVHAYDDLEYLFIWQVVQHHILILKKEVEIIFNDDKMAG